LREAIFRINYTPHAGQIEVLQGILQSKADVIVIDAARGWGKTLFTSCNVAVPRMLKYANCQVMWVAPTYKICKAPIDDVWFGVNEKNGERYIPQFDEKTGFQFWDYKKADMELHMFNGSKLFLRSAQNPNSIVAKGYNIIIVDEAALIDKTVFMMQILPTARRNGCKIVLISTPRGRNWFYELFMAGQDMSKVEYVSFRQPWWKRPDYPELLKKMMKDVPEHIRLQEFEAEFINDGGGTFKNLAAIFKGPSIQFPSDQQVWKSVDKSRFSSENFVVAADLAKSVDYTVITGMSVQKRDLVYYERVNKTDYKIVLEKIRRASKELGDADVIFDATGVGSGLSDFLSRDMNVHPFVFTNQSKNEIVNRLMVACDYAEINLPNIQTMREEFELFSYEITRTGKISYNAPDGKHDDTIMSVALANWFACENLGGGEIYTLDNYFNVMTEVRRKRSVWDEMNEDND
jgi:hypothetical protein